MRLLVGMLSLLILVAQPVLADRATFLDLARRGWNYQLRTTMIGRDLSIPVHINGRDLAGASLCIVGERPNTQSVKTIDTFRALIREIHGKPLPMRFAGQDARGCGSGRTVILRLYSGLPPNRDLAVDLFWMNSIYQLGLPTRRRYVASSPAMAQTFFGRRGQGTHIMVKQSAVPATDPLETTFYRSILIEELFQSFTFGMDILQFDPAAPSVSKLQEIPINLRRFRWDSRDFMRAMVQSNPTGLCAFDVFMLFAVARARVDQTTEPAFMTYIDTAYDDLLRDADATLTDQRFATIMAPTCARSAI